ncbi:MAG: shikimate kinase [Bacteroidota bacterium]
MNRIYLVGFMGVGKSTVGKKLAAKLGWDFFDTDAIFEKKYKVHIDTFFTKYGEELFRRLEHDVLTSTFALENCVISTGGGMPCYFDAMEKINDNGLSIHIDMSEKAIVNRLINSKQKRPLIINKSKDELLDFVHAKLLIRNPYYTKAILTTSALSINIDNLHCDIKSIIKIN